MENSLATAIKALMEIAKKGCENPYEAQKHAASGRSWCDGSCAACTASKTLTFLNGEE
jgi:hypothetical protein